MKLTGTTIGDHYHPAMKITDKAEAQDYFRQLVEHAKEKWGKTQAECEALIRTNLGYFAGYYDSETRRRVEELFECEHPVFGSIAKNGPPTPEQAFAAEMNEGKHYRFHLSQRGRTQLGAGSVENI